jgi:hypothetical protein
MKQETLEEAISKKLATFKQSMEPNLIKRNINFIQGANFGAKWQQERSYNEEDMIDAAKYGYEYHKTTSFPEKTFDDNCKNNYHQHLWSINRNRKKNE